MTSLSPEQWASEAGGRGGVGFLGSPGARLLSGRDGPEDLDDHHARLGVLPDWTGAPEDLLAAVDASGLTGRGGGAFPLARKLRSSAGAAASAMAAEPVPPAGAPVVVVNGTESEPASAKDRLLLSARPHLVLDGAVTAAMAIGARTVIVATHAGAPAVAAVASAIHQRSERGPAWWRRVDIRRADVPDRYVAGESSALVSYLGGGPARPVSRPVPTSVSGLDGRPTLVSNAETLSHLALIARFGPEWFRGAGSDEAPGSVLLTFAGDVATPGAVVEVTGGVTFGEAAREAGIALELGNAVLLGGYAGTWVPAVALAGTPVDAAVLAASGVALGCGLVGVIGRGRCGLVETARLLTWLAAESAGQCGACAEGLPELAEGMTAMADGTRARRRHRSRLMSVGRSIFGRGLCGLPDGAVAMMESCLTAFADEIDLHRHGRCCAPDGIASAFPLPGEDYLARRGGATQ